MRRRDMWIGAGVIVLALLLSVMGLAPRFIETGAWGLSYPVQGQTPAGPADSARLKTYDAVYVGDTGEKVLYLTFDAGYENGCTEKILDTLDRHQVPAAFFLVGNYIEKNGDLVRRMVQSGHIVANHTMHHYDMSKISDKAVFQQELSQLETLFEQTTGQKMPKYYRPPQGIYSQQNLEQAKELGYKTVFWSLAYVDWDNQKQPSREQAFEKLLPRMHNGAVILLHSTSETNGEILDELLTRLKDMGYTFASIDRLFA